MNVDVTVTANHKEVWEKLNHALSAGNFPQSILIEGKPGVGKKDLAMQLGVILKCTSEETKPCGTCFSCLCAKKEEGPNFIWLPPVKKNPGEDFKNLQHRQDAVNRVVPLIVQNPYDLGTISSKSYIAVPMIRDLKERLSYKDRDNRVIFIPEADRMNKNATNALLKVLEEVPDNCYFILTTSKRSALLPTIISRCLQVSVPSMGEDEMVKILNKYDYPVEDKVLLHQLSEGSPGQAMSLVNLEFKNIRNEALQFLNFALSQKFPELLKQVDTLKYDEDKSIAHCDFLYMLLHDLFLSQTESLSNTIRNKDIVETLNEIAGTINDSQKIQDAMKKVIEYRKRLFSNAKPSIVLGALGLDLV